MADQIVGAFEAKTQLSKLLERVGAGEQITITKHGLPIAKLVPINNRDPVAIRQAVEEFKKFSKQHPSSLGGLSLRALREEGRR